jgi:hypothetical protein
VSPRDDPSNSPAYLFIVARDRPDVLRAAQERFADDETILILADRRQGERRQRAHPYEPDRRRNDRRRPLKFWEDLNARPCLVVPAQPQTAGGGPTRERSDAPGSGEGQDTDADIGGAEVQRRLDRWRHEGQRLLGEVIPRLLDEHERMRTRAEAAAQECQKLRADLAALGQAIGVLRAENEALHAQRAVLGGSLEELKRLLEPVARALQGLEDKARWLRSA